VVMLAAVAVAALLAVLGAALVFPVAGPHCWPFNLAARLGLGERDPKVDFCAQSLHETCQCRNPPQTDFDAGLSGFTPAHSRYWLGA
jgi:hypothetical protein